MSNTIITSQIISNELLRRFKNNTAFARNASHEYDKKFDGIGDTYNLRDAVNFTAVKAQVLSVQDVTEKKKPLQITTQAHVGFSFSSKDLTLSVKNFGDRYLKGASVALGNVFDADGLTMAYRNTPNSVGTPGTTPTTLKVFKQASGLLDKNACPFDGDRTYIINSDAETEMVDLLRTQFNPNDTIKKMYLTGRMGTAMGGDWYQDQNVRVHTYGTPGGTPLVNGAGQTGSTLNVKGMTATTGSFKQGDILTLALVFGVNPVSGDPLQQLRQFVVTADTTADGSGNAAVPIYPPITTTGAYKTVTVSPADSAAITAYVAGTLSPQNLVYHQDAFVYAMVPLQKPMGVHFAAVSTDPDTGMSVRIVSQYDINNDVFATRADIMYGWAPRRPEWSCRING
jgi:coat protein Gp5